MKSSTYEPGLSIASCGEVACLFCFHFGVEFKRLMFRIEFEAVFFKEGRHS